MKFSPRIFLAAAAMVCAPIAWSQVQVIVLEEGTRIPVAYAHVAWHSLSGAAKGLEVAAPDGMLKLPVDEAAVKGGVALRIDFIGFAPLLDTLASLAPRVYTLRHAKSYDLDDVVVTGQYRPTTADRAVQRMHVISADQIQRMAAQNLADVLGQELNIRLAQDNVLGTSMSMRGLGGENVKILIDGVPVIGRQDGNLDLTQINLNGIERVEVMEGPLSVNYGTNALAGTINLITRKGSGNAATLDATAYAELVGRLNLSVAAGQRFGKNDLLLTVGRNFFGGWNPGQQPVYDFSPNPADSSRYQAWKPRVQHFARLNYRYSLNKRWDISYKGELSEDRITDRGRPRQPYGESAFDAEYLTRRLDNAVFTKGELGHGRTLNGLIAYDLYDRTRSTWLRDLTDLETTPVPGQADDARFTLANARFTYATARDSAKLGYELGMDLNRETAIGERIADGSVQVMGDYALFASAQWTPMPALTIRPGARYAYNTQYDAPLIPSLDARLQLNTALTLRASYAQGFRAPSLKELHLNFFDVNHDIMGNPDLSAESSNNYSLSLSYRKALPQGVLRGELAGFHDRVHNLITLAQEGATRYSYFNVGEYRTLGGSFGMGWDCGHWVLSAGVAVTGRYDTLGLAAGGADYDFAPEGNVSVTRNWRKQGWSITAFAKYTGEQRSYIYTAEGNLARGYIAPYLMADASVTKQLCRERLAVSAGCKNIADVTDLSASLSSGGAHSDASGGSLPLATGRTFFLRLALKLHGQYKPVKP
jgi:outer membrane receptor for ferrienterochelin and colicins